MSYEVNICFSLIRTHAQTLKILNENSTLRGRSLQQVMQDSRNLDHWWCTSREEGLPSSPPSDGWGGPAVLDLSSIKNRKYSRHTRSFCNLSVQMPQCNQISLGETERVFLRGNLRLVDLFIEPFDTPTCRSLWTQITNNISSIETAY